MACFPRGERRGTSEILLERSWGALAEIPRDIEEGVFEAYGSTLVAVVLADERGLYVLYAPSAHDGYAQAGLRRPPGDP